MEAARATKLARWRLAAITCGLALLTVACGSSSSSSSGGAASGAPSSSAPTAASSPPSSALCADVAALRASLDELTHIKVQKGAKDEITAKLTVVKANLTTFVSDAQGQWQPQISALESALTGLQTAVKNLAANPSAGTVSAAVAALGVVTTAAHSLLAAVTTRCPSAAPSPS